MSATLDTLRKGWLSPEGLSSSRLTERTLTNLYNQRPSWLINAHERLDKAVYTAYGWHYSLDDQEILRRLLRLNEERAVQHGGAALQAVADEDTEE